MANGAFSFLSWVRRGLATGIAAVEDSTPGAETFANVTLEFNSDPNTSTGAKLKLVGPGDIVGLDSNVICRLWPHADDLDAEYIPYPLIEFDQADLPWRYSPAQANGDVSSAEDELRPWFSLVVLASDEFSLTAPTPTQKLAVLNVNDVTTLPTQSELWAWAHTQFEGSTIDESSARSKITGAPGLFTARLMSPRLLQRDTDYIACLVPTFERGRKVGIGEDPGSIDALAPWDTTGTFRLPVYYSWRFRTGTVGDFEQVARLIKPFLMPKELGRRNMDVQTPGFDLHKATSGPTVPLPVEGALMSIPALDVAINWPEADGNQFISDLETLANKAANATEPVLVPPLYGQWYAAEKTLNAPPPSGTNPPWFYQLNSDPRNRVAAALGTQVIQREQQALLASGWDQLDEIRVVNDQLRVLQLARGLLTQIYLRHFKTLSQQRFYQLTARLHAQITCGGNTVCFNIQGSPIIPGFLSAQWLRWARPLGLIGRVQGRPGNKFPADLLTQFNDCRQPAPEPDPIPPSTPPEPTNLPCELIDELIGLGTEVVLRWGLLLLWVTRDLLVQRNGECWWVGLKTLRYAIGLIEIAIDGQSVKSRCKLQDGTISPQDVLTAPPQPANFPGPYEMPDPVPATTPAGSSSNTDSEDAAEIRAALEALFTETADPEELVCPPGMNLPECHASITASLEPTVTVGTSILDRLYIDPTLLWNNTTDPLQPVLAAPTYEKPMYEPLKDISNDWILPGLNQVPRDSIGLAVTNQRFIEAYMVGLNHEMTRELLWNEIPTDQRGTYFRQFWDNSGCVMEGTDATINETMRDIKVMRLWDSAAKLGGNSPRPAPPAPPSGDPPPFLVLVVRAQLIQKYPNVIVYAQHLEGDTLTGNQIHPMFYALLKPDTAFYGFPLTVEQVTDDPTLYFVLQEQPGDPKFADPANPPHDSTTPRYTAASSLGKSAAGDVAETTFLQPFRLGIQASSMIQQM